MVDAAREGGSGTRVGLIGLGLMGEPVSRHILSAGFGLTCFDVDEQALSKAAERGAAAAAGAAEVAAASDVVLVMVPTNDDTRDVCLSPGGVLSGAAAGTIIVLCSSLKPSTCAEIAQQAEAHGVKVLDAPMTGGIRGAENATLTLLAGGDAAVVDEARSVLAAISTSVHHLGPIGSGQIGKTVNNLIHWGEIVVITEALSLGARLGVPVTKLRPALIDASVDSRTLRELEEMKFTWHAKDLADAFDLAEAVDHELPAAEVARERMKGITPDGVERLLSDRDWEA